MLGLLADLPRKNCWTIAEHAGEPSPDGMQHLLARAVWDEDGVRVDLRAYVVEHLGDSEAVLVVDETSWSVTGSIPNRSASVAASSNPAQATARSLSNMTSTWSNTRCEDGIEKVSSDSGIMTAWQPSFSLLRGPFSQPGCYTRPT